MSIVTHIVIRNAHIVYVIAFFFIHSFKTRGLQDLLEIWFHFYNAQIFMHVHFSYIKCTFNKINVHLHLEL